MAKHKPNRCFLLFLGIVCVLGLIAAGGCSDAETEAYVISYNTAYISESVTAEAQVAELTAPMNNTEYLGLFSASESITEETSADIATSLPEGDEEVCQDYVLNKNTHKFHYTWCKSADKIKETNREDYYGSREDLISQGYSPCGNCNP